MISVKRRTQTLGLSLLAAMCGLMAILAVDAQANWLVEKKELTTNETVAISAHSTFKLVVASLNFEIQCKTVASEGFKLIAKSTTSEGKLKISSCTAFSPPGSGKEQKNCKPTEPIIMGTLTLIILHNGLNYLLDEPDPISNKYGEIVFSELCALAETSELHGLQVLECGHLNPPGTWVQLDCDESLVAHLERQAPFQLFPEDALEFGENAAKIESMIELKLSGSNTGKAWGGHV